MHAWWINFKNRFWTDENAFRLWMGGLKATLFAAAAELVLFPLDTIMAWDTRHKVAHALLALIVGGAKMTHSLPPEEPKP